MSMIIHDKICKTLETFITSYGYFVRTYYVGPVKKDIKVNVYRSSTFVESFLIEHNVWISKINGYNIHNLDYTKEYIIKSLLADEN